MSWISTPGGLVVKKWEGQSDSNIVKVVDDEKVITPDGKIHIKSQTVYFNLLDEAYIAVLAWDGERMVLHGVRQGGGNWQTDYNITIRAVALLASEGLL